jgi:hypothetical protein
MNTQPPITKYAKGHVERIGKNEYLAVIHDNRKNDYTLCSIDPHDAQREAYEFCARNGIALQIFTVSAEVQRAHLNDICDFMDEHARREIKPQYRRRTAC